ncbi:MAG: AAA family ATPase [Mycoplasmataceae bacterium]|jgi:predicted AAA+ superfamily ATPase|nr:AAA family ATPase [Mycoplasmataceae bacterium]
MEIVREEYLNKLLCWKEKHVIKVVTGVRRSGKSTILNQYISKIKNEFDIKKEQIQAYDLNDIKFQELTCV